MPAGDVPAFMTAARARVSDIPGSMINISEWHGARTAGANADVYDAALQDADRKAAAIAAHLHARVAGILSVTEYRGAASAGGTRQAGMETLSVSHVSVSANEPVALAVVYAASGGRSIAVFGLADAAAHGAAEGVDVNIYVTGASAAQAARRMQLVEQGVRAAGARFRLGPQAFTVTNVGLGQT